ncbi:MAG: UDP-N-acetylglucosamine--N-acetylmuramyl-(pentapeptide) pyrophosphoryl-undecaprenol N-acetylglucosamine transferase [Micrococcales bacterium]
MTRFLLAGGGTAGHVNPLLALADAISAESPEHQVWALGTHEGIESRLVPERGYPLLVIHRLPFPRRIDGQLLKFPAKFRASVRTVERYLTEHKIEVVVGFGGYASAPAYRAAKRLGIPIVVHEANALPGLANKWAARFASAVGVAFRNTKIANAQFVGMPLRAEVEALVSSRSRADVVAARAYFGLDESTTTLLVTGGSLGAAKLNETIEASRPVLRAAGIQVLHIVGDRSSLEPEHQGDFCRIKYCDRMDLAITAADFAVARAGAATVSEFSAVGLPAVYVPYPVGNGEQRFNVADLVAVGGGVLCLDADFTPQFVADQLVPLISNSRSRLEMAKAAKSVGVADGSQRLLKLVQGVLGKAAG